MRDPFLEEDLPIPSRLEAEAFIKTHLVELGIEFRDPSPEGFDLRAEEFHDIRPHAFAAIGLFDRDPFDLEMLGIEGAYPARRNGDVIEIEDEAPRGVFILVEFVLEPLLLNENAGSDIPRILACPKREYRLDHPYYYISSENGGKGIK